MRCCPTSNSPQVQLRRPPAGRGELGVHHRAAGGPQLRDPHETRTSPSPAWRNDPRQGTVDDHARAHARFAADQSYPVNAKPRAGTRCPKNMIREEDFNVLVGKIATLQAWLPGTMGSCKARQDFVPRADRLHGLLSRIQRTSSDTPSSTSSSITFWLKHVPRRRRRRRASFTDLAAERHEVRTG